MKKVFYRCHRAFDIGRQVFSVGQEVNPFSVPIDYFEHFTRIERTCFEACDNEWFSDGWDEFLPHGTQLWLLFGDGVELLYSSGTNRDYRVGENAIGWRFADQEPEVKPCGPIESIINRVCNEYSIADADESGLYHDTVHKDKGNGRAAKTATRKKTDESERNDLKPAAIEDSHLTPSQRRHWNEMEERQAQKEQAAAAQAELKKSEQAKALQEAADAMGKVNQDHGHKLGWCHEA